MAVINNQNNEEKFLNQMHKNANLIKKYKEKNVIVKDEVQENWTKFESRIKMNGAIKEMNKDLVLKDIVEQKNINIMKPRNVHDINKVLQNK